MRMLKPLEGFKLSYQLRFRLVTVRVSRLTNILLDTGLSFAQMVFNQLRLNSNSCSNGLLR